MIGKTEQAEKFLCFFIGFLGKKCSFLVAQGSVALFPFSVELSEAYDVVLEACIEAGEACDALLEACDGFSECYNVRLEACDALSERCDASGEATLAGFGYPAVYLCVAGCFYGLLKEICFPAL